jgi:hypothetical protein
LRQRAARGEVGREQPVEESLAAVLVLAGATKHRQDEQ